MNRTFAFCVVLLTIAGTAALAGSPQTPEQPQVAAPGQPRLNASSIVITADADVPRPPVQARFKPIGFTLPAPWATELIIIVNGAQSSLTAQGPRGGWELPAGEYKVEVGPLPAGYFVKSVTAGGVDLGTTTLKFNPLAPVEIRVALGSTAVRPGQSVDEGTVTGIWVAQEQPLGPWVFDLKASGSQLTGRLRQTDIAQPSRWTPIFDGRIEGATIRFRYHCPQGSRTIALSGEMRGNEISFKSQVEAALRACGGANLFGQVTDQFVAQRSVGGVIPPVLNRDQQRPPGRGNQPTPPSDEIDIAGIVTVDDGYPRPSFKFSMADAMGRSFSPDVVPRNSSGPAGTFDRAPTTVVIHPPEFTIGLPPGEYRPVVTGLPGGYVVKSIRSGAIDLLKEGFRITNGSQPAPITIALGVNSGPPWVAVSGRVVNASNRGTVDGRGARRGEAPADSIMLVGFAFSEILLAPLGTGGAFEFPRVLPGTYIVRVLPDIPETYASQFRDASSTYEVVVGADGARNIEVVAPAVVTGVMIIRN